MNDGVSNRFDTVGHVRPGPESCSNFASRENATRGRGTRAAKRDIVLG